MSFFSANGVTVGYGSAPILSGVSFCAERGSITGVLGANGCGKTTLIKAICGILPYEGECRLGGRALKVCSTRQIAQLVSYIPQRSGISIDISVLDVALMGFNPRLGLLSHPTAAMRERAIRALERVGLKGREETNYLLLSEGQKQLCILARTLVADSPLLLMDEPESALDFRLRYDMLALLRETVRAQQTAAIVALHDPSLALNYCDQLILLHEGKVMQTIRPQDDPLDSTERALSRIYGAVSLHTLPTRSGRKQLVMLKEDNQ